MFEVTDGVDVVPRAPDGGPWRAWLDAAIPVHGVVAPPSDAEGRVQVAVHLPEGATVGWSGDALRWPDGTSWWRRVRDGTHDVEVHGLTLRAEGRRAWFLRRNHLPDGPLGGITWDPDHPPEADLLARGTTYAVPPWEGLSKHANDEAVAQVLTRVRCAACHLPDRPAAARVMQHDEGMTGPTDPAGLYTPMTLWTSSAPVAAHGVDDPNVADEGLNATCSSGEVQRAPDADGDVRLRCSLGAVATWTRTTPTDAQCATRRALAPYLDDTARQALRAPLTACGVDVPLPAEDGGEEAVGAVPVGEGP